MANNSSVNTWTGYVGDLDTSGVIQLKGIVKDDTMLANSWQSYLYDYYAGISVLERGGKLFRYWDEIEDELIRRGKIAILEWGDTGEFFLADVREEELNLAKGIKNITLSLLDNPDIKFTTKPDLWSKFDDEGKLIPNGENGSIGEQFLKLDPEKYVIFKNNKEGKPYLEYFDYYAQKLVNIVRKMEMDMFMSEKKLMFIVEEQPEEEDIQYLITTFQKGIFIFPNFQYSANPTKGGQKEGKVGINPHNVKFELYEPKTDFAERYIIKFNFWWDKLMLVCGVRYDVVGSNQALAGGGERANSGQVKSSGRTFDAFEKRGWKARMLGIQDFKDKFDKQAQSYILVYGDYNAEGDKNI